MSESEKLHFYLQKLQEISQINLEENGDTALEAIKKAINYIEGEMIGY